MISLRLTRFLRAGPPRHAVALTAAAALALWVCGTAAGAPPAPAPEQRLALLMSTQIARRAPGTRSPAIESVPDRRPITGERTTLPVLGKPVLLRGADWLHVMLPGRPDGSTGWIKQVGTRELFTPWRITVELLPRRVKVFRSGRLLKTYLAVVGKPTTPTPTGRFFVEETVLLAPGENDGPFALALSARSNALQEFEGGPGQIGIHGRDGLGGTLGTAASHGCVRLDTPSIDWLAARIGPGTPVTIEQG